MSVGNNSHAVTKALWEMLAPILGEERHRVTGLVLKLGVNEVPRITVTRLVTTLSDEAVKHEAKTFTIVEVPKEQLASEVTL